MKKNLELEARNGVRLLQEKIKLAKNYEETKNILNEITTFINQFASKKNNRSNKSLVAFSKYFQNFKDDEIQTIIRKAKFKKKNWKEFIPLFVKLHNKNYSNPKIALYMKEKYGISISKETIRKAIKENL